VLLYTHDSFKLIEHRYQRDDLRQISNWWQERMRCAVDELPSKWVESAFSKLGAAAEQSHDPPES
jgi:putative proteasome-type protease